MKMLDAPKEVLAKDILCRLWARYEQVRPPPAYEARDLWSALRTRFPRQEQDLRLRLKYSWLTRRSSHPDYWTPSITTGEEAKSARTWPRFHVHIVRRNLEVHERFLSPDIAESVTRAALSPLLKVKSYEGYRDLPSMVLDIMDSIAFDSVMVCEGSDPALGPIEVRIAQVVRRAWVWSMRQPWFVPSQFHRALRHGRS